jgi:hypothetical protein
MAWSVGVTQRGWGGRVCDWLGLDSRVGRLEGAPMADCGGRGPVGRVFTRFAAALGLDLRRTDGFPRRLRRVWAGHPCQRLAAATQYPGWVCEGVSCGRNRRIARQRKPAEKGCNQDWLPYKAGRAQRAPPNRPQVCQPAPQSTRVSGKQPAPTGVAVHSGVGYSPLPLCCPNQRCRRPSIPPQSRRHSIR